MQLNNEALPGSTGDTNAEVVQSAAQKVTDHYAVLGVPVDFSEQELRQVCCPTQSAVCGICTSSPALLTQHNPLEARHSARRAPMSTLPFLHNC